MTSEINWNTGIPDKFGIYLVTTIFDVVDICHFKDGEWQIYDNEEIVAWCLMDNIKPYKEETMETLNNKTNKAIFETNAQACDIMNDIIKKDMKEIKIDIPKGYEFFGIDDDNKIVLTKKQSQYPKTYVECCKILNYNLNNDIVAGYKYSLLENIQKLLICRDAYYKIAGEQMGLDKYWEPDWQNNSQQKYIIFYYQDEITLSKGPNVNRLLSFPTEEMRDVFYENFKELINECKELL